MTISSIANLDMLQSQLSTQLLGQEAAGASSFTDLLKNAIENLSSAENTVANDQALIAVGDIDDLHTVTLNLSKADLALQTMVQVRNKALDAYKEIMSIPL